MTGPASAATSKGPTAAPDSSSVTRTAAQNPRAAARKSETKPALPGKRSTASAAAIRRSAGHGPKYTAYPPRVSIASAPVSLSGMSQRPASSERSWASYGREDRTSSSASSGGSR
jgi:hypothetical protein